MKRKFYLRGLGIGILVTAVIMGIASGRNKQMTDEEIKARARELGMVESMVLSDLPSNSPQGSPAPSQAPVSTPEVPQVPESSPEVEDDGHDPAESSTPVESPDVNESKISPSPENTPEASVSPSNSPVTSTPEVSPSLENTPEVSAEETVTITIRSGQSSVAVSKMLEEAGLVESASAYDKFLCENGYDKRLKAGSHQIPVGASEEEIARIITSKAD